MDRPTKVVRLKYPSPDRFAHDYSQIEKGELFLPSKKPSERDTGLCLEIHVPGLNQAFNIWGKVKKSLDEQSAKQQKRPPGMIVKFSPKSEDDLPALKSALWSHPDYRKKLNLDEPAKSTAPVKERIKPSRGEGASRDKVKASPKSSQPKKIKKTPKEKKEDWNKLEWLREMVGKEDLAPVEEEEIEEAPVRPLLSEKKELSAEERDRVGPVGEFIMDLVKAMLRTGYYSPDHPGSSEAKSGLYEGLQNAVGESKEIMITNQETRENTDVMVTGILDDPVSMRTVVGAGMAEMFIPKFREYFNRKSLVTFAIKKEITPEHFESFVDIMGDSKVDKGEDGKVGDVLTRSLAVKGITEISTIFMDDMIFFEEKLPWRVEMAIQRLAKDIKVLPMFKDVSEEDIGKMKVRIVEDIIRPLKHPYLLKDIVLNCYVIGKHVEDINSDELERTVIESFPLRMILPTSRIISEELTELKQKADAHTDNPVLKRRMAGVKRILKWIARRVVTEEVVGAEKFLEQLYVNEILTFEELPYEVQYMVNSMRLTKDIQEDPDDYLEGIRLVDTNDDAMMLLRCFRRVAPFMMDEGAWAELLSVSKAVDKAAAESGVFAGGEGLPANPMIFIFAEQMKALARHYMKVEKADRKIVDEIMALMGPMGVETLIKVLAGCDDRAVRRSAVENMVRMGDVARLRIRKILDDPKNPGQLQRNALLILGQIGKGEEDQDRARLFFKHSEGSLREESLNTMLRLEGRSAEPLVIAALRDKDPKVQRRAMACIAMIRRPTDESMDKIMGMIEEKRPKEKPKALEHDRKVAQLILAVGKITEISDPEEVEKTILKTTLARIGKKGGFLKLLKKSFEYEDGQDENVVALAAVEVLSKIGETKSLKFMENLAKDDTPLGRKAKEAGNRIRLRMEA